MVQEQCECPDYPRPTSSSQHSRYRPDCLQLRATWKKVEQSRAGAGQARPAADLRHAVFSVSGSTEVTLPGAWEGDRLRLPPPTFCLASGIAQAATTDLQETPSSGKRWPREQHTCIVLFCFLWFRQSHEVSVILLLMIRKGREVRNQCTTKPGFMGCLLCDWNGVSSQRKEIEI